MRGRVAYGTPMADPTNAQIAAALDELGDLYELDGAVSYRVIAYRNAAKAVRESSVSIIAHDARGPGDDRPGHRQDARGEAARARRDRRHPGAGQAARQVPGRADRGHAPAGLRAQARPQALRRARDRLARRAARGRRGGHDPGAARLRPQGRGAAQADARRRYEAAGGPAPRVVLSRARGDRRGGRSPRCARTRRATASRSRARCAAAPTRSRTSTSSPPRATRRRSRARSASSSSWSPCSPPATRARA